MARAAAIRAPCTAFMPIAPTPMTTTVSPSRVSPVLGRSGVEHHYVFGTLWNIEHIRRSQETLSVARAQVIVNSDVHKHLPDVAVCQQLFTPSPPWRAACWCPGQTAGGWPGQVGSSGVR